MGPFIDPFLRILNTPIFQSRSRYCKFATLNFLILNEINLQVFHFIRVLKDASFPQAR